LTGFRPIFPGVGAKKLFFRHKVTKFYAIIFLFLGLSLRPTASGRYAPQLAARSALHRLRLLGLAQRATAAHRSASARRPAGAQWQASRPAARFRPIVFGPNLTLLLGYTKKASLPYRKLALYIY